ncbi:unnamed protein product, partial [Discosporangium mesarthrocarpum]
MGVSDRFTLTDVATVPFLQELYRIPPGLTVHHGSTNALAEFYRQFWSPSDLKDFFYLSGVLEERKSSWHPSGDLANDQDQPGLEAQLDVEYLKALAPNASTWFYSMADLN